MNDSELRNVLAFATLILGLCVAAYIIRVERSAVEADRNFSKWTYQNDLSIFTEFLYDQGFKDLDALAHYTADFTKLRSNTYVPMGKRQALQDALTVLRNDAIVKTWVLEQGLPAQYFERLQALGITKLLDMQYLTDTQLQDMTKDDQSFSQFSRITSAVRKLKSYGSSLDNVERDLLSHHKSGYIPPSAYSAKKILILVITLVLTIGGTVSMMFISRLQNSSMSLLSLSNLSKKSLFFFTGQYDVAQNTKVVWNWEEPQIVGRTMTFSVRFFHKNSKPYHVLNRDKVTVRISHGGAEVSKMMTVGGPHAEDLNLVEVSFTVHKSGDYSICVMISSRHVKGSPFTKKFEAGPIDASKTGFMNYTSTVVCQPNTPYPLNIEARDSFGNLAAYKPLQNNYFKIKVTECGSKEKHFPPTQIFYNGRQKQLLMQIKMENVGSYQATVSYGDINLKNGDFNLLVLSSEDHASVEKNINKSHNIWYEARLLECNHEVLPKPKKVFIYMTPKQLKLKEYFLKIIGKKLFTYRVCPSTKFTFKGFMNQLGSYVFTIDDGAQAPVVLAAKDRSVIAATFTKFLLRNIGGSETFQDKQTFFYHEVRMVHQKRSYSPTVLKIDRNRLLHSSYKATKGFDVSDWCKCFEIMFIGEEGLDWGGLRREWFETVCTHLFDPSMSGLFKRLTEDNQGLVHPDCCRNGDDLKMFEFAGKIVGKCLYESARGSSCRQSFRQLVKARFSRSFLAQLIGLRVHYKYFETDDPELYKSKIKYIEENDIDVMELTFSEEQYTGGVDGQPSTAKPMKKISTASYNSPVNVIDLIPNGSKIQVTNENKLHYLDQLAQYRLATAVREPIDSFLKGLNELIPDNLLSIFDENELELLMCGMRKYSVADLKANHTVTGSSNLHRRVLDWFWTVIGSFSDEQLARLLQFTTGCSQLPPGGFVELVPKFQISPGFGYNTLPTAHTCFNNLCLPDYDGIEQLHRSLLIAINEGNTGFGLV